MDALNLRGCVKGTHFRQVAADLVNFDRLAGKLAVLLIQASARLINYQLIDGG
ncbi:MAG: hypothetical protein WA921_07410 [Ahrensia sp.]